MTTRDTTPVHTLATRLLGDLLPRTPADNVFVSPVSIFMALAAVANGAAGETFRAIAAALGMPEATPADLNAASRDLGAKLERLDLERYDERRFGSPEELRVSARIANGLWLSYRAEFEQPFVDTLRTVYGAEVAGADFGAPETAAIIDRWVSERTAGNIKAIAGRLSPLVRLLLVNAVHFKGGWASVFKPERTREAPFHLAGGGTVTCDMMAQSHEFFYQESEVLQLVVLPFVGAPQRHLDGSALVVVLPRPGRTPAEALAALGDNWLRSIMGSRHGFPDVDLELPRFRIAFDAEIGPTLEALGMGVAFRHGEADFSNLTRSEPVAISEVRHSTMLTVNEEGAEAAGATAFKMATLGALPQSVEMRVDRPFICAIVAGRQWTPLFVGIVNRPERAAAPGA